MSWFTFSPLLSPRFFAISRGTTMYENFFPPLYVTLSPREGTLATHMARAVFWSDPNHKDCFLVSPLCLRWCHRETFL